MGLFPKCFLRGNKFPGLLTTFLRLIPKITFSLLTITWSQRKNTTFSEGIPIVGQLFRCLGSKLFMFLTCVF